MEPAIELKTDFELEAKFQSFYSHNQPIFLKSDSIVCGKLDEHYEINVLDGKSLIRIKDLNSKASDITTFVASLDQDFVITVTKSNMLEKIDITSGFLVKSWRSCHEKPVYCLGLNNMSTRLVSGAADGTLRLWHIGPAEGLVKTCPGHQGIITLIQFHPTRPIFFIASQGNHFASVWCAETAKQLAKLTHQDPVTSVAAFGELVATASHDKTIQVWSLDSFQRLIHIPTFELTESIWFLPAGALTNHLTASGCATESRPLLISGGEHGHISVWNCIDGLCVLRIQGPASSYTSTPSTGTFGLHSIARFVAKLDSSELGILRHGSHLELHDPQRMKIQREFLGNLGQVQQMALIGNDKQALPCLLVADASPNLKLFTRAPETWTCHQQAGGHDQNHMITEVCVSPCGSWVLTGAKDCAICLWQLDCEAAPDKPTLLLRKKIDPAHCGHISAMSFFQLSSRFVSVGDDCILKVWNFTTKAEVQEATSERSVHESTVNAVALAPKDRLLASASRDKTVKIWAINKNSGLQMQGVLRGHKKGVWSVNFSKHERLVVTAASDGDVRLWNLRDFSCVHTYEGQGGPVYRAEFISQGLQIIACDQSGCVRVWHTGERDRARKPISLEAHEGRISALLVTRNEQGFFTGAEDSCICYYKDVSEIRQLEKMEKEMDLVENNQLLANYLQDKSYSLALRLSLDLEQPRKALGVLQTVAMQENNLDELFRQALGREVPRICKLLAYAAQWNTRAKSCWIAQLVLGWVVRNFSHHEVASWPNMLKLVEGLLVYSKKHYRRVGKLEEQVAIVDYLKHLSNDLWHLPMEVDPAEFPSTSLVQ